MSWIIAFLVASLIINMSLIPAIITMYLASSDNQLAWNAKRLSDELLIVRRENNLLRERLSKECK